MIHLAFFKKNEENNFGNAKGCWMNKCTGLIPYNNLIQTVRALDKVCTSLHA